MRLFVNSDKELDLSKPPTYVVCVDPGQNTLGVYVINMETKKDLMLSFPTHEQVMGVSMGVTISSVYDKSIKAFNVVRDFIGNCKDIVFICEQTTSAFSFSAGIISSLQTWFTLFKSNYNCPIIFVSNRITAFFLKKKKIANTDSKKLILSQRPDWKAKIDQVGTQYQVYSHPCDAVLMCWAVYYDHFEFKSLRKLKTEIVYI